MHLPVCDVRVSLLWHAVETTLSVPQKVETSIIKAGTKCLDDHLVNLHITWGHLYNYGINLVPKGLGLQGLHCTGNTVPEDTNCQSLFVEQSAFLCVCIVGLWAICNCMIVALTAKHFSTVILRLPVPIAHYTLLQSLMSLEHWISRFSHAIRHRNSLETQPFQHWNCEGFQSAVCNWMVKWLYICVLLTVCFVKKNSLCDSSGWLLWVYTSVSVSGEYVWCLGACPGPCGHRDRIFWIVLQEPGERVKWTAVVMLLVTLHHLWVHARGTFGHCIHFANLCCF